MNKRILVSFSFLVLILGIALQVSAQAFTNSGFENGNTGWTCQMEVNTRSVYGGTGSGHVAEVDGHDNPNSTADDRLLCQTISGFIVGSVYALEFDATRRPATQTPATVTVRVKFGTVIDANVSRTGGWNMIRERFTFTANSTSLALHISPNFTTSYGMLFDNFSISMVSPLPVTLVRFEASATKNAVELEWSTASEQNNAVFIVQRSTDTEVWEDVAEVEGAGNSQSMINYNAVDPKPLQGISYYRLEQIDLDGTVDRSDMRSVIYRGHDAILTAWPNPATDRVHVRTDAPNVGVSLYNALGLPVYVEQERSGNVVGLDISTLPKGPYFVRTTDPQGTAVRFIKQ